MKRFFLLLLACLLVISSASCKPQDDGQGNGEHIHDFSKKVTTEPYLIQSATCKNPAIYYYSCECGMMGEEFFFDSVPSAHKYIAGRCTWCDKVQPDNFEGPDGSDSAIELPIVPYK